MVGYFGESSSDQIWSGVLKIFWDFFLVQVWRFW
jgi:hypothetical protein